MTFSCPTLNAMVLVYLKVIILMVLIISNSVSAIAIQRHSKHHKTWIHLFVSVWGFPYQLPFMNLHIFSSKWSESEIEWAKHLSLGILKDILISNGLNRKWKGNALHSPDTNNMTWSYSFHSSQQWLVLPIINTCIILNWTLGSVLSQCRSNSKHKCCQIKQNWYLKKKLQPLIYYFS